MVKSPTNLKIDTATASACCKPSTATPHPNAARFQYHDIDDATQVNGCVAISMAAVMDVVRVSATKSTTPTTLHDNDDQITTGKLEELRLMIRNKLKPLHCASAKSPTAQSFFYDRGDVSYFSESGTFEGVSFNGDLLNRLESWKTIETQISDVSSKEEPISSSNASKHVQFQCPIITSMHLRPRTESDDIDKLFFAPEELDQIYYDQRETRVADDVETLVVGTSNDDWEQDVSSPLSRMGCMNSVSSPRNEYGVMHSPKSKRSPRFVQGVQILLREKSHG